MRVITLLCIVLLVLPAVLALTKEEATVVVETALIAKSPQQYRSYAYVWPVRVLSAKETHREPFTFEQPVWFFWIDPHPELQFGHSSQYVFVHENGFYHALEGQLPPTNLQDAELFYVGRKPLFQRIRTYLKELL